MLTKEAREKAIRIYATSEQNTTYQVLTKEFPNIPSHIRASLNQDAVKCYNKDRIDVVNGKKSIRNYRNNIPIPFPAKDMEFSINDEGNIIMGWFNNITFMLNFGRDRSNNKEIVERAMSETYKYSSSKIQIKGKKMFLLFCVDIPTETKELDPLKSVGVDLGIAIPAVCASSDGKDKYYHGNKDEFLRIRTQMQYRRRQLQSSLKNTNGGRGRKKKLKALDKLEKNERNWVKNYNHNLTKKIIEFALKIRAGVIKLEFLEGFGEDGKKDFILRNWSFFEIQQMLSYKAKKYGIEVVFVDPYHTSQSCSCCEHYEEGQREEQSVFKCKNFDCKNFDKKINADYNAALNLAKSDKVVTSKEECEYYKNKQKKHEEILVS